MKIYGIDFSSRPGRGKPLTCMECQLSGTRLSASKLHEWPGFEGFDSFLQRPGPWVVGLDFPFGQSRRFIENIGWPLTWEGYVGYVSGLSRGEFRSQVNDYKAERPAGDKEHTRRVDRLAKSVSPQKLNYPPVGLMFFEGAPRLLRSGVCVPGLSTGDPQRTAIEAYPGVLARSALGKRSYKNDSKDKQTLEQTEARHDLMDCLLSDWLTETYGLQLELPDTMADMLVAEPGGDRLDALLCAVQAAWAQLRQSQNYGAPEDLDPLEGWIADPVVHRG